MELWQSLLCFSALFLEFAGAAHVFDVYRCIQLDMGNTKLGCRKSYLSVAAAAFNPSPTNHTTKPTRQALVVRLEELTLGTLDTLCKGTSTGILILLPAMLGTPGLLNEKVLAVMHEFEHRVLHEAFEMPIYFAVEDEKLTETYESLKRRLQAPISSTADDFSIVVSEKEAEAITDITVTTMQGVLQGGTDDLPTFAIVTHYDTLGVVPGLTKGTRHNGSGVAGLFELIRLFAKLYGSSNKAPYNLVFLLSGGGRLDYAGTKRWLGTQPPTQRNNIEFALCLENLAGNKLHLHISRKPKDENIRVLYESFSHTAQRMGIPFELVSKKINVSSMSLAWEHEAFSYRKIVAATLSADPAPTPFLTRSSVLDTALDQRQLERNIAFIAEVIAQYIYTTKVKDVTVFKGSIGINSRYVTSWLQFFSSHSRATPYMPADNVVIPALSKAMQKYLTEFRRDDDKPPKTHYKFYGNVVATMHVYTTKPLLFDILLAVPILLYLLLLDVYFKGMEHVLYWKKQAMAKMGIANSTPTKKR